MSLALPARPADQVAAAVVIGAREVGVAVVTRERLLHGRVLNVRKIRSAAARERRFAQVLDDVLEHGAPGHLVVVVPKDLDQTREAQLASLARIAAHRGLARVDLRAPDVRRGFAPVATTRALSQALCERYPTLAPRVPVSTALLSGRAAPRSERERYWTPLFLAVGAAALVLDRAAVEAISSYAVPPQTQPNPAGDPPRPRRLGRTGEPSLPRDLAARRPLVPVNTRRR
jgi:hypothetical protein